MLDDFSDQADILINRFHEKGYDKDKLLKLKADIMKMDRTSLFCNKNRNNSKEADIIFVTGFNSQFREFESIVRKY